MWQAGRASSVVTKIKTKIDPKPVEPEEEVEIEEPKPPKKVAAVMPPVFSEAESEKLEELKLELKELEHEAAGVFPVLEGEELDALRKDIDKRSEERRVG